MDEFDRRSAIKLGLLAGAAVAAPTVAAAQGKYTLTTPPRNDAGQADPSSATAAPNEAQKKRRLTRAIPCSSGMV